MNEETIIQDNLLTNGVKSNKRGEKKLSTTWKYVTLGGVSGILMGAGAMFAVNASASESKTEEIEEANNQDASQGLQVAEVSDDLSFGEAFNAAREEVGPGGVFHWHGGIYNTYTAEEWEAMSAEEKDDFAQIVLPEVRPDEIPTPTDAHPDVTIHEVHDQPDAYQASKDVSIANGIDASSVNQDDVAVPENDVRIIGYTNVEGHLAVGYDMDSDGHADVAIIDVDDNRMPSAPDIAVDSEGNMATLGEIFSDQDENIGPDPSLQNAYMENPEVAPDMPDYMPDADVSDMSLV